MRRRAAWFSLPVLIAAVMGPISTASAYCSTVGLPDGRQVAELQTTLGELCIELLDDPDEAPGHVENFLYYLDQGDVAGTLFHRLVPDFVVQGGQFVPGPEYVGQVEPRPGVEVTNEPCTLDTPAENPTICSERGNEAYTVALAKRDMQPNSGTTSWFINLKDNRSTLDDQNEGFTVFGRLLHSQSRATADRMGAAPIAETEDHFWMGTGFAYQWLDEGQGFFQLPDNPVPLSAEAPYDDDSFGCLDMRDQATIVLDDALPQTPLDPDDPDSPRPAYHIASAACGDPVESTAGWVKGEGTPGCPEADRLALLSTTPGPTSQPDDDEIPGVRLPAQYVSFTCEQLRESDDQRAAWRAAFADLLIEIESATVRVAVPEPGGLASAAAALACLGWLRRRSS